MRSIEQIVSELKHIQGLTTLQSLTFSKERIAFHELIQDTIATLENQKIGEWELFGNDDDCGSTYFCSVCHKQIPEDAFYGGYKNGKFEEKDYWHYCPQCGAKMMILR